MQSSSAVKVRLTEGTLHGGPEGIFRGEDESWIMLGDAKVVDNGQREVHMECRTSPRERELCCSLQRWKGRPTL